MKKINLFWVIVIIVVQSCSGDSEKLKIVDAMLSDKSSYFYTDLSIYKEKDAKLPIGIFDSGTGGLTVLDAIVNYDQHNNLNHSLAKEGDSLRDFNSEKFIYLADQANMPYGNYGANNKSLLLKEHVLKDAQFLLSNQYYKSNEDERYNSDKAPIKALVIACNTATAYAKEDIESFVKKANLDLKVIGVIGAGVRAALENLDESKDIGIGVMATAGTVSSLGYVKEIKKQTTSERVIVYQQAGVGLAGAVDGASEFIDLDATLPRKEYKGPSDSNQNLTIDKSKISRYNFNWENNQMLFNGTIEEPINIQINSVDNYIAYHVTNLLEKIISHKNPTVLKKIILGCTHYPFYTEIFQNKVEELRNCTENGKFIYNDYIAEHIDFIDPALYTAKELYEYLGEKSLFNNDKIENSEFYISVPNTENQSIVIDDNGRFTYDYKYGREVNEIQQYVKRVPFSKNNIPSSVFERLEQKIPYTYSLIKKFNQNNSKTDHLSLEERL